MMLIKPTELVELVIREVKIESVSSNDRRSAAALQEPPKRLGALASKMPRHLFSTQSTPRHYGEQERPNQAAT